jgi:anti-sigma regulatory factor (Ser/Thr protein kinase)
MDPSDAAPGEAPARHDDTSTGAAAMPPGVSSSEPGFVRVEAVVDDGVDLHELRSFVRNAVELLRIGPFANLDLLSHELVKNALALEEAEVRISVQRVLSEGVRVEVRDYGYGLPVLVEESDEGVGAGMGLTIVDRLADSWGVDQFLPGKIVWFQFDGPVPAAVTGRG